MGVPPTKPGPHRVAFPRRRADTDAMSFHEKVMAAALVFREDFGSTLVSRPAMRS